MYCKNCGANLPSKGFICKNCGALMNKEQIEVQKGYLKDSKEFSLLSDRYHVNKQEVYNKRSENKFLGAILIVLVLIVLIILAILLVM